LLIADRGQAGLAKTEVSEVRLTELSLTSGWPCGKNRSEVRPASQEREQLES